MQILHRGFFMPAFDRILQLARMEEMDCEFVEVTAHEGARPTHAVWQGRVYHRGGAVVQDGERYENFEAATGYGTGPGLCGWNCRHNFYPFYPGVSVRNYTDDRLAELDARNIPYGGGLYTRYEIAQMQRALERRVRKYKRRYLAETAAGVDAGQSAAKLKAARQQLSAFLAETGERVDGARTEVPGENFSAKKQTAYAARKNFSVYSSLNMEPKPVTMQSISNVKAFSCDTLDAAGQQQLKNAHKRLLMIASKLPPGVEVGRLFDLHMKPLTQDVVGAQNGHTVKLPNPSEPYVAIHTHPACGNFSNGDLSNFTNNSNLKLLTAIGHNSHVYAIEKTDSYNATQAQGITDKLNIQLCKLLKSDLSNEQVLTEAEGLISESIKELQNYGIKFYE